MSEIAGDERVAADPDSAEAVAGYCGGLPLALRIVATRLAGHPAMTMATMARRLREQRGRLDELHTGDLNMRVRLALSLSQLDAATADLLRLLSAVPGPHTAPQAARLQAIPLREARARLEELDATHLLHTADCELYEIHDLVRLVASERPPTEPERSGPRPLNEREKKFHRRFTQAPSSLRADPLGDPPHTETPRRRVT